jgi:KDO2-lipid IV(A) lauroyltransferase
LPLKVLYCISDFIAFFLRRVIRYRSEVVNTNLARSFPDLKYRELSKIIKRFYRNFSDIFIELLWSASASRKSYYSKVELENPEELRSFHDQGKSAIIVLGHQTNWENLSVLDTSPSGFTRPDLRIVYKSMRNKSSDMLLKWIRERNQQGKYIESKEIARYMFRHRKEQLLYVLIADQSPLPGAKFAVNFLNQPTFLLNGPEQLSKKYDLPVVYANSIRVSRGKYRVRFTAITGDPSKTEDGEISAKFAALLEAGIRANPSDWLWSHKRWKRDVNSNAFKNK